MRTALVFSQYGPYHVARAAALSRVLGGEDLIALQIAAESNTYAWNPVAALPFKLETLCKGPEENASFGNVFFASLRFWKRERIDAAFLPSYAPASSLALLLSAKLCGIKCVMMNESHAGTERARGLKRMVKKFLVCLFDGALVGGQPQMRHFVGLGMDPRMMYTGYDCVDNLYFRHAADVARSHDKILRAELGLPVRYILSLGRMVKKKNLELLVDAFAIAKTSCCDLSVRLVFVGSGECRDQLIQRCIDRNLVVNCSSEECNADADVFFFGFSQIEDNPKFYGLAECFVLPSLNEEWGLVVNEAMACGLPVIVSRNVGSAEDLVQHGLNGFQFDPSSSSELAEQLLLISQDSLAREHMGIESIEIIGRWGCENFAIKGKAVLERIFVTKGV